MTIRTTPPTQKKAYEAPRLFKVNLRPEKPILLSCSANAPSVETGSCGPDGAIPATCQVSGKL